MKNLGVDQGLKIMSWPHVFNLRNFEWDQGMWPRDKQQDELSLLLQAPALGFHYGKNMAMARQLESK